MRFPILIRFCNILLLRRQLPGWRLSAMVWAVFIGLTAWGLRTSVNSAGHGLEASTTSLSTVQAAEWENSDSETKPGPDSERYAGTQPTVQSDRPEGRHREDPDVPEPVLKDLASRDPGSRLRALDYWNAKDIKLSLAPVFDAMEDEDEAVRARATAIIDQQWTIEHEIIDLTFSTAKSTGGRLITRRP